MDKMILGRARVTYGKRGGVYRVWWGKLREREHLENPGIDGRTVLNWIFRKCNSGMDWNDPAEVRQDVEFCECGNEPSDSIKCREFLD
jgi:hypothetical protein